MKSNRYFAALFVCAAGIFVLPAWLVAQEGLSHARVVRLSYVHGTVAIQRPGATDWANAMVNTPLQEGFALSTSKDSYAEVEFENGSTARLGELSRVNFTQLALTADGDKLNRLSFQQGYGTFHFLPEHGDVYAVKVANTTVTPHGKAEFRTNFNQGQLQVEVFDGTVDVEGPAGSARLGKDKVLDFDTQSAQAYNIHQGIQKDDWDKWSENRDRQSTLALKDSAVRRKSGLYGWSDLDTYGEWGYFPGYGYGWAPYASAGWSPYSMGMWSWYPGFGWTWISSDPWGWLPYHCGFWNTDPTFGWFWMPGFDGCSSFWSPALVTWYMGPGWVGWAPAGTHGGGVTAVPPSTVQNGQPIGPGNRVPVPPRRPKPMDGPPFAPSKVAMLGGTPLASNVILPGMAATTRLQTSGLLGVARSRPTPAPPTVLMGADPKVERAQLTGREGFLARGRHGQPLRAQLGTTLGGRFKVAPSFGEGAPGASRGMDRMEGRLGGRSMAGSGGFGHSGPVLLPHGSSQGGGDFHGGGMTGGGFSAGGSGRSGGSLSTSSSSTTTSSTTMMSPGSSGGASAHSSGGGTKH